MARPKATARPCASWNSPTGSRCPSSAWSNGGRLSGYRRGRARPGRGDRALHVGLLGLKVPNISVIIGEGGSGGAIAIATANQVYMLEHAIYSVISPEGAASILWHDSTRARDAATNMKITAQDLLEMKIIDGIVAEPLGGAHRARGRDRRPETASPQVSRNLAGCNVDFREHRREKYLAIGRNDRDARRAAASATKSPLVWTNELAVSASALEVSFRQAPRASVSADPDGFGLLRPAIGDEKAKLWEIPDSRHLPAASLPSCWRLPAAIRRSRTSPGRP